MITPLIMIEGDTVDNVTYVRCNRGRNTGQWTCEMWGMADTLEGSRRAMMEVSDVDELRFDGNVIIWSVLDAVDNEIAYDIKENVQCVNDKGRIKCSKSD